MVGDFGEIIEVPGFGDGADDGLEWRFAKSGEVLDKVREIEAFLAEFVEEDVLLQVVTVGEVPGWVAVEEKAEEGEGKFVVDDEELIAAEENIGVGAAAVVV